MRPVADYAASSSPIEIETVIFLYIDPGAGSMVIQGLLAAALAIPFFFRTHIGRAVQRFRTIRGRGRDDSSASS